MFDFVGAGFCRGNSVGTEQQRRAAMICEGCSVKFTVFKRKRQCSVCRRYYCSHCLPFRQNDSNYNTTSVLAHFTDKKLKCSKCEVLTSRPLSRAQLQQLRVKDLQLYLISQKVSTRGCVEKDDLVNLLMLHAGNSSNNTQRSDFPIGHGSQADTQSGSLSSMVVDQTEQLSQEQSTSTAYLSSQCVPSTSETPPDSDYLGFSITSDRSTKAGSGESTTGSSSSSGSQFGHKAPIGTNMSVSPEDMCHISTSSSSSTTQSSSGWSEEHSVVDVDIVELTDWTGDLNNLDAGPEPVITVIEDDSPERTFNEVEVMETDELADVAVESEDGDYNITAGEAGDETAGIATEEPTVPTQSRTGITLASISGLEDFEKLTVKQLKELLSLNRVDYRGCCERQELMERVARLWQEDSQTRKGLDTMSIDELCKICMDAPVECVMLECGHMATCVTCGKQLSECPICRQFVVRVVRTFKA